MLSSVGSLASSSLVAGTVGATLAILGNFWIQGLAARRERRRYIAQLAAEFLAHDAALIFNLSQQRRSGEEDQMTLIGVDVHLQSLGTAGTELSLVARRRVVFAVQEVSGLVNALMLQSVISDAATWRVSVIEHGEARLKLIHAVRRFVKSGAMSDDDLGHDAIDESDPSTTHTLKRGSTQNQQP